MIGFAEAFAEAATLADADVDADCVVELNRILDRGMSYVHLLGFNGDIPDAFQRRWTNVCRMETEAKSVLFGISTSILISSAGMETRGIRVFNLPPLRCHELNKLRNFGTCTNYPSSLNHGMSIRFS